MSVQFEEQEFNQMNSGQRDGRGAVASLVMKLGLAKTAAQANVVMLVITVLAVGLTVYLLFPSSVAAPQPGTFNQAPAEGNLR